jgi:hypothetical protein
MFLFPHPLRKQLDKVDECSPLQLDAVHLHVRSAADVGASRMLAVRDRLRRDVVATAQYNALKVAVARGEISQPDFEHSCNDFFFAAVGDGTGSNSSGASVWEDKSKEQVQQEGGTLGPGLSSNGAPPHQLLKF